MSVKLEEVRKVRKTPKYMRIRLASLCVYRVATYSFQNMGL